MEVFSKPRLTSTRQTGSLDSISTKTNSHLKLSTDSHSFRNGLVPFQKSPLYFWAQEKHSCFDLKGRFKMSSATYVRQGRKSTERLMNFIHLLPSTIKSLCLLQPLIPMLVLKILVPLGIVHCPDFKSIFKGETEQWRSWAGLNHTCYGLASLGKQSITSSFQTLPGLPAIREEPAQPCWCRATPNHEHPEDSQAVALQPPQQGLSPLVWNLGHFLAPFIWQMRAKAWSSLQRTL